MRKVLFCHGLESGPFGRKYQALVQAGYEVLAPDCRGMALEARVALVTPLLHKHRPYVVGSSYGGLAAVLAGMRAKALLPGLVLCAPALERVEAPNEDPEKLSLVGSTTIVHGVYDSTVPVEVSRRYAQRTGAKLLEVLDDHRLDLSLAAILKALMDLSLDRCNYTL